MIQKVRLEHARRLLHTELPITEVALQCGYTDHSAFTRQFKSSTGFTPRQYRQATQGGRPDENLMWEGACPR